MCVFVRFHFYKHKSQLISFLQAQVTTDSNFTIASSPVADPITLSDFTVPSGNNRVLVVAVASFSNNVPTSVTYGGTAMTQAIVEDAFIEVSLWYLALGSGAAVGPSDIVANSGVTLAAVSFQNVHQTAVVNNRLVRLDNQ